MRTCPRLEQVSVLTLLTSFCWEEEKGKKKRFRGVMVEGGRMINGGDR
jgi:hypothetical protein